MALKSFTAYSVTILIHRVPQVPTTSIKCWDNSSHRQWPVHFDRQHMQELDMLLTPWWSLHGFLSSEQSFLTVNCALNSLNQVVARKSCMQDQRAPCQKQRQFLMSAPVVAINWHLPNPEDFYTDKCMASFFKRRGKPVASRERKQLQPV